LLCCVMFGLCVDLAHAVHNKWAMPLRHGPVDGRAVRHRLAACPQVHPRHLEAEVVGVTFAVGRIWTAMVARQCTFAGQVHSDGGWAGHSPWSTCQSFSFASYPGSIATHAECLAFLLVCFAVRLGRLGFESLALGLDLHRHVRQQRVILPCHVSLNYLVVR